MRVYLADLGHNAVTVSSDTYPLGVANLITYARAHLDRPVDVEFRIFREPQDLEAAIDLEAPDVLGLSSYSWNHNLSLAFARHARRRRPETITLMGGPNFPLTPDVQESWLAGMPEIDVAVRGPTYEGERAFLEILRRIVDVGGRRAGLLESPVPGSMWIDPHGGGLVVGPEVPRIADLDEIPSPYVSGLLDPYFKSGYFPLLQIARGCPFTCSFCNSSVKSNSRICSHSLENVQRDLLYVAERVDKTAPLCLADDNFGMYEVDVEVADYVAHLQDRFGWPNYIRTTTGKNRSDRIVRVMRKIRGVLPMTSAVQSMNPVVLKNIERSNIKLEAYAEIQKEVRAQGMQSYGEMILCLPGETKASFLKGVSDLLDTGVKRVSAHQLMLLHGAPLSTPESRRRFGFQTRFRVVARDVGRHTGEPVVELEEMVVETPTFSFDDYLDVRVFHLLLTIFYYEGNMEEAFEFAQSQGVKPFDLVIRLQSMLPSAPPGFRKMIADFVAESREELFPTPESCREWAVRHLDGLVDGSIGGNLLSKYSMLGRFFVTQDALDFLEAAVGAALGERRTGDAGEMLSSVMDYLRAVLLHVPFAQTLAASVDWTTQYDVDAWRAGGYAAPLASFRLAEPRDYEMKASKDCVDLISNRLRTFGEHPAGLGKFTRTMFARDLRRNVEARAESTAGR